MPLDLPVECDERDPIDALARRIVEVRVRSEDAVDAPLADEALVEVRDHAVDRADHHQVVGLLRSLVNAVGDLGEPRVVKVRNEKRDRAGPLVRRLLATLLGR